MTHVNAGPWFSSWDDTKDSSVHSTKDLCRDCGTAMEPVKEAPGFMACPKCNEELEERRAWKSKTGV